MCIRDSLGAATIGVAFEPRPLTSSQRGVAHLRESTVLLFAYHIHRFPEVLGDVKLVMHDIRLGHAPVSYTHLRAHETVLDLVCRLLLEKKNYNKNLIKFLLPQIGHT